jgi:hypothetical protein
VIKRGSQLAVDYSPDRLRQSHGNSHDFEGLCVSVHEAMQPKAFQEPMCEQTQAVTVSSRHEDVVSSGGYADARRTEMILMRLAAREIAPIGTSTRFAVTFGAMEAVTGQVREPSM